MIFREATEEDIRAIQSVRHSVAENILSDPNLVTDTDCLEFISNRGKGWVCEIETQIVGFSIVDLTENNVWALFLTPEFENLGIGSKLHDLMLDWYFEQTQSNIWLGTEPKTRADRFYRRKGWQEIGTRGNGETKFEMTLENWKKHKKRIKGKTSGNESRI